MSDFRISFSFFYVINCSLCHIDTKIESLAVNEAQLTLIKLHVFTLICSYNT